MSALQHVAGRVWFHPHGTVPGAGVVEAVLSIVLDPLVRRPAS